MFRPRRPGQVNITLTVEEVFWFDPSPLHSGPGQRMPPCGIF